VALELALQFGLDLIEPLIPGSADLLVYVHLFSKWFVGAAFAQFGIESLLELAVKDAPLWRRVLGLKGGSSDG